MPKLEFMASALGRAKVVEEAGGRHVVDVCDEVLGPIPFSCRSATCATCQVVVVEGLELLEPAADEERALLDVINAPQNSRLACQAVVKQGTGVIRMKPMLE